MKKILRITAVVAATIAFFSCNNGAYDAQPDNHEGLNHLNPTTGVKIPLGNIKVVVNGVAYLLYPGGYLDTAFDGKNIGFYCGVPFQDRLPNSPYVGIQFRHADEGARPDATLKTSGYVIYSYIDPKLKERVFFSSAGFDRSWDPTVPGNIATPARIEGTENGNIRGTLGEGKYYLMPTHKGKDGQPVKPPIKDSVLDIRGEFHLPPFRDGKVPFKI